jgi:hypothetical protein
MEIQKILMRDHAVVERVSTSDGEQINLRIVMALS